MCLRHIGEKSKTNVKLFIDNIESWEKVQKIRLQRISNLKEQAKWNQVLISLLSYFQRHHDNHGDCYKTFTAYSVRCLSNETASTIHSITTRPTISGNKSLGVFPAKCIIFGKERKKIKEKLVYPVRCEKYET